MPRGGLDRSDQPDELFFQLIGFHVGEGHHPGCERARLVEEDRVDVSGLFEHLSALEEDPELSASSTPHHDRGGGGQSQGARAGDDQNRNPGLKCRANVVAEGQPNKGCPDGEEHDSGHEDPRDAVGETLRWRLGSLGFLDHPDDRCQGGVGADSRCFHRQASFLVDGAAEHIVALSLVDREGLTGEHGLVEG